VETLEGFQQNRRVIEDFTQRTLEGIPSGFGRLLYVASLRDLASGRYCHEGLSAIYPQEAVQQALDHCHQQLFLRILEWRLAQQEWDLRACLGSLEGEFWGVVGRWRELEFYRCLVPCGVPEYLQELFCSNLRSLLTVLEEQHPTGQPAA
jgi:hypothetical protein